MLTGVSLFAGIGGFDLAMQRQGVKVVASVEIDKKCNEVLSKHFPNAKQFTDDWTLGVADSTRYRQIGNAVAVPVVEWIIQNIVDVAEVS